MTTPIVQSISDEQLAELADGCMDSIPCPISALYELAERLIAAEAYAKRWRHARNILTVEAIESAQSDYINFGLPPAESESIRADKAIDAAMECTP
ncbi:hypothetical protein SOK13_22190 [Pseudomonas aeruginosa]|uniref:hypothetical protein n=1 Tax=Pseudomonas aeruginosa TaxID=287 RepID=UPI002A6A97EA|nr:hypothetical protein [Pseudomonas aeruginosa]MDY1448499.1 hypothetical protein [Pseudomonas aeruginosa]